MFSCLRCLNIPHTGADSSNLEQMFLPLPNCSCTAKFPREVSEPASSFLLQLQSKIRGMPFSTEVLTHEQLTTNPQDESPYMTDERGPTAEGETRDHNKWRQISFILSYTKSKICMRQRERQRETDRNRDSQRDEERKRCSSLLLSGSDKD